MPWGITSEDNDDLVGLRAGLDADHYGLEDIKERIIEFCAVRALKPDKAGGIITLVGPPGTGKTSIGISIAKQLGREFYRFSVGGMRDEAEIKGHRRTYVGALPGKNCPGLASFRFDEPRYPIDEIDKPGKSFQGDPALALLEVLDPEQNRDFLDHYLDIRLDLSQVLFVARRMTRAVFLNLCVTEWKSFGWLAMLTMKKLLLLANILCRSSAKSTA